MDIKHIKNLIALMTENDLSDLEVKEGETQIVLRRGKPPVVQAAAPAVVAPVAAPVGEAAPAAPAPAESNDTVIRSPMVGTFYAAPDPDSAPFVNVGDEVNTETVVCLVEAMKVFNEIKAEVSGRLTKVLVSNGQAVEFDQPLFAVAPA
ncbi:acetyl-CoA carboxylase biotin carboxyl carrier protein [uncultured Ilyobacter sp.]|uniref:acetyl-CoA carboxylase biotin carboxyl carrier protein n=1 Tax=uncultured Ilyobacter sp. TaxID=544433 RepID=UPI0029F54341|nr:acetyl-CoA carboxylase biotin carboxyl carrier protein [uncultured Ilyobacter sp.]